MARPKTRGDLKTLNINIKAEVSEELNRYVEKNKIEIYDSHIIVANITDMKRIVDTRSVQRAPAQGL